MSKLQIISVVVVLCVAAVITIPFIRGYQIQKAETAVTEVETARAVVEPSKKVILPEKKDDKIWESFKGKKWGWVITRNDRPPDGEYWQQEKSGDMELYQKIQDEKVGHAPVEIYYVFYKKQLMGGHISCQGEGSFAEVSKSVFAYYGKPQLQKEENTLYWAWPLEITNGKVWATLTYDEATEETNFNLWYQPLQDVREKEEHEAAMSGKDF